MPAATPCQVWFPTQRGLQVNTADEVNISDGLIADVRALVINPTHGDIPLRQQPVGGGTAVSSPTLCSRPQGVSNGWRWSV